MKDTGKCAPCLSKKLHPDFHTLLSTSDPRWELTPAGQIGLPVQNLESGNRQAKTGLQGVLIHPFFKYF